MNEEKLPLSLEDVRTILDVARRRAALVAQLKQAILNGDTILEHELAREVCGLPKETTQ